MDVGAPSSQVHAVSTQSENPTVALLPAGGSQWQAAGKQRTEHRWMAADETQSARRGCPRFPAFSSATV